MKERRTLYLRYHSRVIESLGWVGFRVIAQDAEWAAWMDGGWSDAATVSERLEWRHVNEGFYGIIVAAFEVVDA